MTPDRGRDPGGEIPAAAHGSSAASASVPGSSASVLGSSASVPGSSASVPGSSASVHGSASALGSSASAHGLAAPGLGFAAPGLGFPVPADAAEAVAIQDALRGRLVFPASIEAPRTVTGLDISYAAGSTYAVAAAVVLDVATREVREVSLARGHVSFPYVPGLLAFREIPLLLEALAGLARPSEVVVCDGYGVAHPRRFGLACHLGVVLDLPVFGVAKTAFIGSGPPPGPRRGEWAPLADGGEVVGRSVRTQKGVKPVFVSAGHRIGLADATDLTVRLSGRYRIPEPTRQADILSRRALR